MPEEVNIDDLIDLRTDEERIVKLKVTLRVTYFSDLLCLVALFIQKHLCYLTVPSIVTLVDLRTHCCNIIVPQI